MYGQGRQSRRHCDGLTVRCQRSSPAPSASGTVYNRTMAAGVANLRDLLIITGARPSVRPSGVCHPYCTVLHGDSTYRTVAVNRISVALYSRHFFAGQAKTFITRVRPVCLCSVNLCVSLPICY